MLLQPHIIACKYFYTLFPEDIQIMVPKKRATCYNPTLDKRNYSPHMGMWFVCYKMNLEKDFKYI